MQYEWRHEKTGKVKVTDSCDTPPGKKYKRVFSVGIGPVPGGASPSRASVRKPSAK